MNYYRQQKIDEEPLQSIIIERPKKKAFLDSFKEFNLQLNKDDDDFNPSTSHFNNNISKDDSTAALRNNNSISSIEQQSIPPPPKPQLNIQQQQQPTVEKKLFTLLTTIEDDDYHTQTKSKLQQRIEEFKQKGTVSSPKLLESKKERINKNRREERFKQITTNRNSFTNKEDKEFFSNLIELEKTADESNGVLGQLSKEEEELICNYKPLLVEHLQQPEQSVQQREDKFVYDYYVLEHDNHDIINSMIKDRGTYIPSVQLPPEEDYDFLNDDSDNESSVGK
eukprot:gene5031-6261_t